MKSEVMKGVLLLKACISKLLSYVSESLITSIEAIEELNREKAVRVLKMDEIIDDLNREVEKKVCEVLRKFDLDEAELRYVLTMIKFSNNLERIGDLACNIAEKVIQMMEKRIEFEMSNYLKDMFGMSIDMVHGAFRAFSSHDVELAIDIWRRDVFVDELEMKLRRDVEEKLKAGDMRVETAMLHVLLARDVERIADHATNLCEEIVYIEKGVEIEDLEVDGDAEGSDSGGRRGC